MSEMLLWLTESGERLTVIGILIINIFVIGYGVQKKQRWWVPGWMMTACEEDNIEKDKVIATYVARTQDKLDRLEALEDQRAAPRKRSP